MQSTSVKVKISVNIKHELYQYRIYKNVYKGICENASGIRKKSQWPETFNNKLGQLIGYYK